MIYHYFLNFIYQIMIFFKYSRSGSTSVGLYEVPLVSKANFTYQFARERSENDIQSF